MTVPCTLPVQRDPVVLASQSPRRRELLSALVGTSRLDVVPPQDGDELGFEDCESLAEIDARLLQIARGKHADAARQLQQQDRSACIVAADTVVIVTNEWQRPLVLGKPPDQDGDYRRTVSEWFVRYYAGRPHLAKTGLCVGRPGDSPLTQVVTTEVWFRSDAGDYVDWYLGTDEPRGKAGGYAIQGAGSLFVERIAGSLSNVIGLPLAETLALVRQVAG